jgi:hypothetical protein
LIAKKNKEEIMSKISEAVKCKNCIYWVYLFENQLDVCGDPSPHTKVRQYGSCNRHAPTPKNPFLGIKDFNPHVRPYEEPKRFSLESRWPMTEHDDWCGDFAVSEGHPLKSGGKV